MWRWFFRWKPFRNVLLQRRFLGTNATNTLLPITVHGRSSLLASWRPQSRPTEHDSSIQPARRSFILVINEIDAIARSVGAITTTEKIWACAPTTCSATKPSRLSFGVTRHDFDGFALLPSLKRTWYATVRGVGLSNGKAWMSRIHDNGGVLRGAPRRREKPFVIITTRR